MNVRRIQSAKMARQARRRNQSVRSHASQGRPKQARRASMGERNSRLPFAPPEDWYEPTEAETYRIVVQPPGDGYRHVVTLSNGCQQPVSCEVWTDVDPTPHYTLQANPGKSAEVIVRNGSPASEVHAGKLCRFAR